jgi:hypothetical protein
VAFNPKDYRPITFYIKATQYDNWLKLLDEVTGLANANKSIPTGMVKVLLGLLVAEKELHSAITLSQAQQALNRVMEAVKQGGGFEFMDRDKQKLGMFNMFSLIDLLTLMCVSYFTTAEKEQLLIKDKDAAFGYFYNTLSMIYAAYPPELKEKLTQYKRVVLAAYFTSAVGFRITPKAKASNSEIYRACRNALKKAKTAISLYSAKS